MNSNINKFNEKSEFYNKYRPKYSEELINYIVSSINKNDIIADIGCGTGIFTKQLVEKNCNVIGIEPNKEMYEKARKNLPEIRLINATAENTTLDSNSVDVITIAQALHWFNIEEFTKEAKRILKQDGRIAIIYNSIDDSKEIIKEFKQIHKMYCKQYNNHNRNLNELFESVFKEDYTLSNYYNNQRYTFEEFIGYSFSLSYSLREDDEKYKEYVECLEKLFNKYENNGFIELPMLSKLAFGKI